MLSPAGFPGAYSFRSFIKTIKVFPNRIEMKYTFPLGVGAKAVGAALESLDLVNYGSP